MDTFKQLLSLEIDVIKLLKKYNEKPTQSLYNILQDYLEKEKSFFSYLSIEDFTKLYQILSENYHMNFERNFMEQIMNNKNYPLEILRIYAQLYFAQLRYTIQPYSSLSITELEKLRTLQPVQKILEKYQFMKSFFERSYFLLKKDIPSLPEYYILFVLDFSDLLDFMQPVNSSQEISEEAIINCYPIINGFFIDTLEELLQVREEKSPLFLILNTFLEIMPISYREQVQDSAALVFKNYPKLRNSAFLRKLIQFLEAYQIDYSSLLKFDISIETSYEEEMIPSFFTYEHFLKFSNTLFQLKKISYELFQMYLKIILQILNNQKDFLEENIELFVKYYDQELEMIDQIPDFDLFYDYVVTYYPERFLQIPFDSVKKVAGFHLDNFQGYQEMDQILFLHVMSLLHQKYLSMLQNQSQQDNFDFIDLTAMQKLTELNTLYLANQIPEEEFLQEVQNCKRDDSSNEDMYIDSCMEVVYENYLYYLYQSLSPQNKDLYYLCYLLVFLDPFFLNFALHHGFQVPNVCSSIKHPPKYYPLWQEESSYLIEECLDTPIMDPLTEISVQAYYNAILSTYMKEDQEKLKQQLKRKRDSHE